MAQRGEQMGTALLYSSCQTCRFNECVTYEFNDKSLNTKNNSKRRRCVITLVNCCINK